MGFILLLAVAMLILYWFKQKGAKKVYKTQTETEPRQRTMLNTYYLVDTENADRVRKYYTEDLVERDEYYQSAKELKEYYDHEKVWKYEPVEIPFKLEGRDVYTNIEDEWFKIGRVKKTANMNGEVVACYFYVKEYKYVTEDYVEKEKGDDFFGIEVKTTITI